MITHACSVCAAPYAPVSDDPSPAHPGCDPGDRERYEAATRGPRTYTGRSRPALHEAGCRVCGGWIALNELVSLADVDGTRAWIHDLCAEQSGVTGPQSRPQATESAATALPQVPGTPAGRSERSGDDTTAPRRAA